MEKDIQWLIEKVERGDMLSFIYFWGHLSKSGKVVGTFCLSQWYESPFTADQITYKTAEHWMMAQKALLFQDNNSFEQIIACGTPAEAKALGRSVSGYSDLIWDEHKYGIVKQGNILKFSQNPALADYLLQTGDAILVEASPVDKVWGIGLKRDSEGIEDVRNWPGQNLLGFALMEVRDFLAVPSIL